VDKHQILLFVCNKRDSYSSYYEACCLFGYGALWCGRN